MDDFDILSKVIDECATNEIIKNKEPKSECVHSIKLMEVLKYVNYVVWRWKENR